MTTQTPRVWVFAPSTNRTDTHELKKGTQLNADELRRVLGFRLERAEHTGEPTQIWKHGDDVAVLVTKDWFWKANELMREAGHDYASADFTPLPARQDGKQKDSK